MTQDRARAIAELRMAQASVERARQMLADANARRVRAAQAAQGQLSLAEIGRELGVSKASAVQVCQGGGRGARVTQVTQTPCPICRTEANVPCLPAHAGAKRVS